MAHRPTLYIGIGGSGCKTLALIKKNFTEEFGEGNIPGYIRFFGIDTDICIEEGVESEIHVITPQHVSPAEHLAYHLQKKTGRCDWYIDNNWPLPQKIGYGSALNRPYARLVMEMDISAIMERIRTIISELMDTAHSDLDSVDVDVRFVMSLTGAAGSGIFLPLAVLLSQYRAVNLFGYAVMHGIFKKTDPYGPVQKYAFIHTYSSILELDYLQHASIDNQIKMSIAGTECILKAPLFKGFYMVDHLNDAGKIIQNRQDMFKVLSLSMFSSSLKTGTSIDPDFANGKYDIKNKKGWLGSVGACEIVYNGEAVAELYSYKAAQALVESYISETSYNTDFVAGFDTVFDTDFDIFLRFNYIDLSCTETLLSTIAQYIGSDEPRRIILETHDHRSIQIKLNKYTAFPSEGSSFPYQTNKEPIQLKSFLGRLGDNTYRIKRFLERVSGHCQRLTQELEEDLLAHKESLAIYQKELDKGLKNISTHCSFGLRQIRIKKNKETLENTAYQINRIIRQITLGKYALEIIATLKKLAEEYTTKASEYHKTLENVHSFLLSAGERREKELPSATNPFTFDTTVRYWDEQIKGSERKETQTYTNTGLFIDFLDTGTKEVEMVEHILKYTDQLSSTCAYRELPLGDVINSMSKDQYCAMLRFIRTSAIRMLTLNGHGYEINGIPVVDSMTRNIVLSIYGSKKHETMEQDMKDIWNSLDKCETNILWNKTTEESFRQRGVISLHEGGIIPYCIECFYPEKIQTEYTDVVESGKYNPHTDSILFERMKLSGHSLKPEQAIITPKSYQATVSIAQNTKKILKEKDMGHTTKVFIAGSKELAIERALIREELSKLQNTLDTNIRSLTFEDFPGSLTGCEGGRQTEYNKFIRDKADIVIFIFDSKAGSITEEEFDVAYDTLAESGRPEIFVYARNMSDADFTLKKIKDRIFSYGKEYYIEYKDHENLRYLVLSDMMKYFLKHAR